jgi:hypothetical protein
VEEGIQRMVCGGTCLKRVNSKARRCAGQEAIAVDEPYIPGNLLRSVFSPV